VQDLGFASALTHQKNCMSQGAHLMSIQSAKAVEAVAAYGQALYLGLFLQSIHMVSV
jgi:hypothetical protein